MLPAHVWYSSYFGHSTLPLQPRLLHVADAEVMPRFYFTPHFFFPSEESESKTHQGDPRRGHQGGGNLLFSFLTPNQLSSVSLPPPSPPLAIESRTDTMEECEIYKEQDVLEEVMMKLDECDMEKFCRVESSEKTIAILGNKWCAQTAKQDGDRISKQFLCNIWKKP